MSDLRNAKRLWLSVRREAGLLLSPGEAGMPEAIQCNVTLTRGHYASPSEIATFGAPNSRTYDDARSLLLVRLGDFEARPSERVLVFAFERSETTLARISSQGRQIEADLYLAATSQGLQTQWLQDLGQGQHGYFVTGTPSHRYFSRIRKIESDFMHRLVFTIQPLTLPNGLPTLDFSAIRDAGFRVETERHWTEFVEVMTKGLAYRSVSAAKDVAECVLLDAMVTAKQVQLGNRPFADLLKTLLSVIEADNKKMSKSTPFELLHYHLMSKLRVLHGSTHPGRAVTGSGVSPEIALSVGQDLIEIVRAAGLIASEIRPHG